jgi:hypothetical protein
VVIARTLPHMKHRTTFVGLSMMGVGLLLMLPLGHLGYGMLAGAVFIVGMLTVWVGSLLRLVRRLN